jgi:ferritin-like metal-binding protein YciE
LNPYSKTKKSKIMNKSNSAMKDESKASPSKKTTAPGAAAGQSSMKGDSNEKLEKLFVDELKDIYWAENALVKALPKMAKKATLPELKEALEGHLEETKGHVERLNKVFEIIGVKAQAKKCEAMDGLIKEGGEIMDETEEGSQRDAGIISAGQKVEHYEIATYGTLRAFAETLGYPEAVELLGQTLQEEKAADQKLTEVTSAAISEQDESEEGEDEEK